MQLDSTYFILFIFCDSWRHFLNSLKQISACSFNNINVSLRLRVQNRRKKWNFPLNFQTMRKLSDLYSRIFQTQSSGCASGVDLFRNFTNLKILNIWIVKYLLNCKRYLSYNFWIFQKISECWVLENLDVHLERTTSELEFWNFQHDFYSFQNILKFQHDFLQFQNMLKISTCFFIVFTVCCYLSKWYQFL